MQQRLVAVDYSTTFAYVSLNSCFNKFSNDSAAVIKYQITVMLMVDIVHSSHISASITLLEIFTGTAFIRPVGLCLIRVNFLGGGWPFIKDYFLKTGLL